METLLTRKFREFLPGIYQRDPAAEATDDFLDVYLSVFEDVLSEMYPLPGGDFDLPNEGVESILSRIHEFFSPWLAPGSEDHGLVNHRLRNFLDWLTTWAGLVQKAALNEEDQRRGLARVIPIYRKRGTKAGLKEYLEIFTGYNTVTVLDTPEELQKFTAEHALTNSSFLTGNNFTFAVSIRLNPPAPGYALDLNTDSNPEFFKLLLSIIEREKPAHADALLGIESNAGFIVGVLAMVGKDTFLGRGPVAFQSVNGVEIG